jgi:serine/threonine protein kinase
MDDRSLDDPTLPGSDATVLRAESSLSASSISEVSGGDPSGADIPKVLKQRFVLEDKLGSGGMGTVFRAKDLRKVEARDKQPHVAIKVLNNNFRRHPEAFIALEREASKSQTLRHSNIVSIFDFDKDGNVPFITMELLEGRELGELLKAYPNGLPDETAWSVVRGIVAGLAHAHDEHVVHADFKPGNVFVTHNDLAKILDFGIARAMRVNQTDSGKPATGKDTEFDPKQLAALTPAYASREMLNGDNPEPRDDLYSLGVVIYMVFSGHHPYGRLNANDAASEKLKPERIKRLSRRQWKVLERCLEFNRQDRPDSAEDVFEAFFGKSSWHVWGLAAALATLTVTLVATTLNGSQELETVKSEVRQNTLVDSQVARITELMESPEFDASWNSALYDEMQSLGALAPGHGYSETLQARARELYTERVLDPESGEKAFGLYAAGAQFGGMPEARDHLVGELFDQAEALMERDVSVVWLAKLTVWIERFETHFADSVELGLKRLELVDYLRESIPKLSDSSAMLAESAYGVYAQHAFDIEDMASAQEEVTSAVAQETEDEQARELAEAKAVALAKIDALLNVSCLRLDVDAIADELESAERTSAAGMRNRVRPRISACVERLRTVDPDRALALGDAAVAKLGSWLELDQPLVDPCGARYLVGNGQHAGRAGYCSDELDGATGPRLVVVPGTETLGKFAISKYEVSWREFSQYCRETGACSVQDESDLPVTNVSLDAVLGYARWLSGKTGYRYRLPKLEEWARVAEGQPDPNRNCRVDAAGVTRGFSPVAANAGSSNPLGVYHILGNVQELVAVLQPGTHGEDYVAVGGAYADPIDACLAATKRPVPGSGDDRTGFRLVREVS